MNFSKKKIIYAGLISGIIVWMLDYLLHFYYFHPIELSYNNVELYGYEALRGLVLILLFTAVSFMFYKYTSKTSEYKDSLHRIEEMSETNYESIFNSANDAIFVHDINNGDIMDVNSKMCELFGCTREEAVQMKVSDISAGISPYTQKEAEVWIRRAAGGVPQLFDWVCKDKFGRTFWAEVNLRVVSLKGEKCVLAIVQDISERKMFEQVLKKNEERFELAMKGCSDGFWDWPDISKDELWWSSRFYEMLGYNDGEIKASYSSLERFLHTDDYPRFEKAVNDHLKEKVPFDIEFRIRMKTCEFKWFHGRGQAIWDGNGNPTRMSGSIQDISSRKRMEEDLKESENTLRSIFKASPVGIGLVADRTLIWSNEKLSKMVGYSHEELFGQSSRMLYPTTEDFEYVGREKYRQIKETGTGTVETKWKTKDGRIIDVLLSSSPLNPENYSAGVTFTALDITEWKYAENEVRIGIRRIRVNNRNLLDNIFN